MAAAPERLPPRQGGAGPAAVVRRRLRTPVGVAVAVGVVVAAWAAIAIPARATVGARTTADEPQYLLSALSLAQDGDLRIDDELAARAYLPFHEVDLPAQTVVRDDGSQVSPHDPLLPVILAVPMRLGGWAAAKGTLAVLAGALAALLVWTAHRRFAVPLGTAALTVLAFGVAAPLSAYGTQVYPELPAALAVTAAIAAVTGRRRPVELAGLRRRGRRAAVAGRQVRAGGGRTGPGRSGGAGRRAAAPDRSGPRRRARRHGRSCTSPRTASSTAAGRCTPRETTSPGAKRR